MSREVLLARAQAAAEQGMADSCVITRVTGRSTNTTTGDVTPTSVTVYTGTCRVQQASRTQAQREDVGEDHLLLLRFEIQLPVSLTGLDVGDRIAITAVGTGRDADLVGRVFRVHDLAHKTDASSRRPQCLEVTGS